MSESNGHGREALRDVQRGCQDMLRKLRSLAAREPAAKEFFHEFLQHVAVPLASPAAAVWLRGSSGRLELEADHRLSEIHGALDPATAVSHSRLLEKALTGGGPLIAGPGYKNGDGEANPTPLTLLVAPLKNHRQAQGVVELFQPPETPAEVHPGQLFFLQQACTVANEYLQHRWLRDLEQSQAIQAQFERFAQQAHASLRRTETAYTIANEARRLLECDRVSVTVWTGRRCRVEAISNQDVFDRRSNVVRQLTQLATCVAATGEPFWFQGERTGLAPQMEAALDAHLDESHAKLVVVVPLRRPQPPRDDQDAAAPVPAPPVGALVIERFRDTQSPAGLARRVELVQEIAALALANAQQYEGLFFGPLSRGIQKLGVLRHRPWFKLAGAALLAALLALVLVPADFDLQGRGTLEPVGRHDIFAPHEGVVRQVLVEHDALVRPGQLLVQLDNTDVAVKLRELRGQRDAAFQRLRTVNAALLSGKLTAAERERQHGERTQLLESLKSLRSQVELYERKAEELQVRSTVAGKVVTWDVQDLLIHRPVERGQMLLSVANVDGQWELEVRMPEDRMGHIARARTALGEKLPVTFILATEPGRSYEGTLEQVHARAEVHGEEGNVVLLKVAFNKSKLSQLRRGATVIAKVHCGRRALGYVWFHDLVEFVQSRILFRL
jgi:multidrug efflux pump subunit AcrA (membrane-fusion protein)